MEWLKLVQTERLVAARELTPEIYSNKVEKVDFLVLHHIAEKFQRNFTAPNLDKTHKWKFSFQIQLSTFFYTSWRRMTWRTIQTPWKSSKGNQNKHPYPTTANTHTHSLTIVSSRSGIGYFLGAPQFLFSFLSWFFLIFQLCFLSPKISNVFIVCVGLSKYLRPVISK